MSNLELAMIAFPAMLGMIFIRIPIAIAMAITGFVGTWIVLGTPNAPLAQLKTLSYDTFASYSLSIVPLFLLMGQLATKSGLSEALFKSAADWLGHRKGGIAMAAIGACAGFGAICGSSLATASTMGQVALPELRRYGYSDGLATGVLAAGGTLGILIPPSVILVIYAILTEQNIIKMFMAALIPGLLAAAGYMLTVWLIVHFKPGSATTAPRKPYAERFKTLLKTWPVLAIFTVVIGGIYVGFFTPTESAAVGTLITGVYAVATGRLSRKDFIGCFLSAGRTTGMIFLIVLGATLFNSFLAFTQAPVQIAEWVVSQGYAPLTVLALMLLFYLVFGCVMDSLSMILLTIPVFFPIIEALDFGMTSEETAIWFGILVLIVVEVGLITPPVGLNLFVINSMAREIPIRKTYIGVIPFVFADLLRVVILVAFPFVSLFLVRIMF